ncbi:unnamed protein product [Chilo suppressalis]|uniref:DNA recombination and repair protein Rad51-like C-terminal domain-containing protein n=1 Tax=Chilo suppressalis TaxID=168631 RepID=A0ABN8B8A4_CHISP|nr:unnamed protein product [Chilo suppressalis]
MASSCKIETGMQLLARLTKQQNIEKFYPVLFENGPRPGEVIELYSESNINPLLIDIICEALLPSCFGDLKISIIYFNCNGNFNYDSLLSCMSYKISTYVSENKTTQNCNDNKINELVKKMLSNIFIAEIYDASQFYISIHNLERVFLEHSNIAMIIVDTITAFYWSEQAHKICKMDTYTKKILQIIQKVCKDHKLSILYTRPEHFSSSKDSIEAFEPCNQFPVLEKVNYRIQVVPTKDESIYNINIRTHKSLIQRTLYMDQDKVDWI